MAHYPRRMILLVEDDPALRLLTARALKENGFDVLPCSAAPDMWQGLDNGGVELIILDIMLLGTSGIDLCRRIRRDSDVPIIFISAKGSETDRVIGLELGADDYIFKPFGTRELVARVRAVLRRYEAAGTDNTSRGLYQFDGWVADTRQHELRAPSGAVVE